MAITLSRTTVAKQKGIVILPVKEYQRLLVAAVPIHYLTGKAAKDLDALVAEGLKEHRKGKTVRANSFREAIEVFKRKRHGH